MIELQCIESQTHHFGGPKAARESRSLNPCFISSNLYVPIRQLLSFFKANNEPFISAHKKIFPMKAKILFFSIVNE